MLVVNVPIKISSYGEKEENQTVDEKSLNLSSQKRKQQVRQTPQCESHANTGFLGSLRHLHTFICCLSKGHERTNFINSDLHFFFFFFFVKRCWLLAKKANTFQLNPWGITELPP